MTMSDSRRGRQNLRKRICLEIAVGLALAAALAAPAAAQGFGASISPPRFELQVKAGQTLREVIDIQHVGGQNGKFRIYTNDWTLQPDGSVGFSNELGPDSCRAWVAVEKRELTITPNARYRYRFEITPPPDTAPRECRFAIMVEGSDPARVTQSGLDIPVGGRIAVIVYASINGAAPQLAISPKGVAEVNGKTLPALEVRNTGVAHGRVEGFLSGIDAAGHKFDLSPSGLPILPGETRTLTINPVIEDKIVPPAIEYPLKVTGTLEWGANRVPLEHTFTR
ncbi:MAG: hypothetical protein JWP96_617 [Polaromonas sp.]|nr:hypothetical protein [Polaromonas sp.]